MIDVATCWSLLRAAARSEGPRVGPPGAGLARSGSEWSFEAELDEAARDLADRFLPVLGAGVVAHLAQSLDGRVALADGSSQWISGEEDLEHTHRLRALSDAVVVGAHTVQVDDPRLTVRRVPGEHPLRVVLDPSRRLGRGFAVFSDRAAPTLRVVAGEPRGEDELGLPAAGGRIDPAAIVEALRARGLRRVLIEGGGLTVSRFVAARCVDRLHLVIAPVLVGAGRPGLALPEALAPSLEGCPRPRTEGRRLGKDWLLDCALR